MTDREILGLGEHFTGEELKRAYRSRCKQIHPDRNGDTLKSHLAMIRLNRAYDSLLAEAMVPAPQAPSPPADEAYPLYREGVTLYQAIHPSRWKSVTRRGLFDPSAVETSPETAAILEDLMGNMARAYRCFSRVVREYPRSPWGEDSLRKIREIEKMTLRYERIRDSYKGVGPS